LTVAAKEEERFKRTGMVPEGPEQEGDLRWRLTAGFLGYKKSV
jgi:hypothetical protein